MSETSQQQRDHILNRNNNSGFSVFYKYFVL